MSEGGGEAPLRMWAKRKIAIEQERAGSGGSSSSTSSTSSSSSLGRSGQRRLASGDSMGDLEYATLGVGE